MYYNHIMIAAIIMWRYCWSIDPSLWPPKARGI